MVTNDTDSALGSALMTLRGFQWVYGARQDPYALLLRAESDDPHELGRRVRDSGTLTWSSAETWVTAHHAVAAQLLADERLALRQPEPDEAAPAWGMPTLDDVLPMDAAMLKLGRAECARLRVRAEAALLEPTLELLHKEIALAADRQAAELPAKFDVMTDYAYPVAIRAVALLLGVPASEYERFARLCAGAAPALDATLCPPKVETAKLLLDSLAGIRELCDELVAAHRAEPAEDLLGAVVGARPATRSPSRFCSRSSAWSWPPPRSPTP
jgi:glycosyltransferase auxiliary protein